MFEDFSHPLLPYTVTVNTRGDILRNYSTVSEQGTPADLLLAEVYRELQELKAAHVEPKALLSAFEVPTAIVEPVTVPADKTVNINTATLAEIEALPYIGRAIAAKIVSQREGTPFTGTDNLIKRTGLKISNLEAFEGQVRYE